MSAIALGEAATLLVVLFAFKELSIALAVCGAVSAYPAIMFALGAMHQPDYFIVHLWWLAANFVLFIAASITASAVKGRGRVG